MGKVIHYFEIEFNLMQFAVNCYLLLEEGSGEETEISIRGVGIDYL
jgi:hypothetical protein